MMRRAVLLATGLAVAGSIAWTGGMASASHPGPKSTGPVTFTGTFMADITGTITFSPPLTNTVPHETIVTTTATSTQVSGNLSESGSVIRGASMTGNGGGGIPGSSCLTIFAGQTNYGIPLGELQVVYKTKSGTRAAAPTAMFFAPLALTGSSVLSAKQKSGIGAGGSFGRSTTTKKQFPTLHLIFDQSLSTLQAECAGAGLSQLTFTGVAGKSRLYIG